MTHRTAAALLDNSPSKREIVSERDRACTHKSQAGVIHQTKYAKKHLSRLAACQNRLSLVGENRREFSLLSRFLVSFHASSGLSAGVGKPPDLGWRITKHDDFGSSRTSDQVVRSAPGRVSFHKLGLRTRIILVYTLCSPGDFHTT